MHRLDDDSLILSATDATSLLACRHLFEQRRAIAHRERTKPRASESPHADLVRERGDAHERAMLAALTAAAGGCVTIELPSDARFERAGLQAAADETVQAMRDGAPLIAQAVLFDGRWQGQADFLRRIELPGSTLAGGHGYEVLDAKLARSLKPALVHQLSLYDRLVAQIQGVRSAGRAYAILGDGEEYPIDLSRFAALHRHVCARVEALAAAGPARGIYPEPVAHCAFCVHAEECDGRRRDDDHLSLVANLRRDQRDKLAEVAIETVAALGAAGADHARGRLGERQFELARHQAALQVRARQTRTPTRRQLGPERQRGYARLPAPSAGDLFFDFEGDPYIADGGLEFLWGWTDAAGAYGCLWAHDADAERAALRRFVALVDARRAAHPDMHVYHYAPHEAAALKGLALRYATCEDEIDDWLRGHVLVDLYGVVRQGLQVGEERYSLKTLERHHGFERHERSVRAGGGAIVAYERWLADPEDGALLEAIRAYNEEDCRSTAALRDWLWEQMRPEAAAEFDADFDELAVPAAAEQRTPPDWLADAQARIARLTADLGADPTLDTPEQSVRRLLSHLQLFHQREAKPAWWRYFELSSKTATELVDERDAIGELVRDASWTPRPYKRSLDYRFTFPPQEHKLGGNCCDPATGESLTVVEAGPRHVILRRGDRKPPPAPEAIITGGPYRTDSLRRAIERVIDEPDRHPAAYGLLRRELPRLCGDRPLPPDPGDAAESARIAAAHTSGPLVVQGPPGTGKTYRGARMIVACVDAGLRVAVSAQSHAAIMNLLADTECAAHAQGVALSGVYKSSDGDSYTSPYGLIDETENNTDCQPERDLVAGTAWLLAALDCARFDVLFIDEAGQYSLANAVAAATSAQRVVLLGDPQQLPQVCQAEHPGGSGGSVLDHLLAGAPTVPPDRGLFLPESWRMHSEVCAFSSERSYEGRLRSRADCARRRIDAPGALRGAGLRSLAVAHEGRSQSCPEEAAAIAAACRELLAAGTVTDEHGLTAALRPRDILVVAPYNLAVACIADAVPAGVRVGTVDRFQGQEAPVVFYAMTCSSGEDVPRGIDFLFDDHRLNVAISRAQALAVLVHSPRLLEADCATLEAMALVDGVCRLVEMAEPVAFAPADESIVG